jgi:hypothetical protein
MWFSLREPHAVDRSRNSRQEIRGSRGICGLTQPQTKVRDGGSPHHPETKLVTPSPIRAILLACRATNRHQSASKCQFQVCTRVYSQARLTYRALFCGSPTVSSGNWFEGSQVSKARPGAPFDFTLRYCREHVLCPSLVSAGSEAGSGRCGRRVGRWSKPR